VIRRLDYVAGLGFDVLYLPPIHPIGRDHRKGRNNALAAMPTDPGSPWAIGAREGGHRAIHPELGTLADFQRLIAAARERGMEVALDIALQCAPDHPYVKQHPDWFLRRPDGSTQYAENPPKKYEDIYPLNFDSPDRDLLWHELRGIFLHWADAGVRIFRVDNPHTKSFRFWEWTIAEVKRAHPDTLFLAEAFTRPKVMHYLAKLGFTQSYTYFTWRESSAELTDYFTELSQGAGREYFRPNCWPNTPDILPAHLQEGGLPAFRLRLVLAATLAASYGIYGPAFELGEHAPREAGSEEYLDSEKYEVRHWDLDRPDSLAPLIASVNGIRRKHPALQSDWSLRFHATDNENLLCYSKQSGTDTVLVVVNLDPRYAQSGWTDLDLAALGRANDRFTVIDLLSNTRYAWQGQRNFIKLDPTERPAHIFTIEP
jgi:starch synthase (maltosyl-transferring)